MDGMLKRALFTAVVTLGVMLIVGRSTQLKTMLGYK